MNASSPQAWLSRTAGSAFRFLSSRVLARLRYFITRVSKHKASQCFLRHGAHLLPPELPARMPSTLVAQGLLDHVQRFQKKDRPRVDTCLCSFRLQHVDCWPTAASSQEFDTHICLVDLCHSRFRTHVMHSFDWQELPQLRHECRKRNLPAESHPRKQDLINRLRNHLATRSRKIAQASVVQGKSEPASKACFRARSGHR